MAAPPAQVTGDPFVAEYTRMHGRAPRVLHIGNIANNAFLNARILNQSGWDCDVMCADYYHIMGCPEWEEADFSGAIHDQFRPDWTAVDLHGYQRPAWFAQGPQQLCIDYLTARRTGDAPAAARRWEELGLANQTLGSPSPQWSEQMARKRLRRRLFLSTLQRYLTIVRERPDAAKLVSSKLRSWAQARGPWAEAVRIIALPMCLAGVFLVRLDAPRTVPDQAAEWQRVFAESFPDREDQLTVEDCEAHLVMAPRWKALFDLYDVVLAYSTDGIIPLFAGVPYVAFEHGTLREIPYRKTGEGRRTALCYRLAEHVMVTNFDCLGSAEHLAPGRFTLINHPFDEDRGLSVTGADALRAELRRELDCDFICFFPTRHDWVSGEGYADKGNDVFLRGFAALCRDGFAVGLVCCAWGANVEHSKALLAALGCARHVKWISPLPTVQFERMCRAAHCVVDQFVLGSFGGVMFKALGVGAPVVTYLDENQLLRQYPQTPPVINCRTDQEIVAALSRLIHSPDELEDIGRAAREWISTYHAKADTVRLQALQFRRLLEGAPDGRHLSLPLTT